MLFGGVGPLGISDETWELKCLPVCPGDIDRDDDVGFRDLLMLLSAWGACSGCPEDFNADGTAGFADLLLLLANWGPCPP